MSTIRRYKISTKTNVNLPTAVGSSARVAFSDNKYIDVEYDPNQCEGIESTIDEVMLSKGFDLDRNASGIDDHDKLTLPTVKARRFFEIDRRTDQLVALGFEFPPGSGMRFSLALTAQSKIIGIYILRDNPLLTYPINFNNIDDNGFIPLADAAAVEGFMLTAAGTLRAIVDSGTAIKDLVRAAPTIGAVLAVVDPR